MSTPSPTVRTPARRQALGPWVAVLLLLAGCADTSLPEPPRPAAAADSAAAVTQYTRELVFVGEREATPLLVPFTFTAAEVDGELLRSARSWLVHGTAWEAFLDESWRSPAASGVWRVLPHGDLRVLAGGPAEIEALVYRRGDRSLRLLPQEAVSAWTLREDLQYRIHTATLQIGGQSLRGSVLESFRVQTLVGDELDVSGALDWLFVTNGADVRLVLAEVMGARDEAERTFAWGVFGNQERHWDRAQVRWLEVRPIEQARRDVPVRWSFAIPGTDIEGEVFSLGHDLQLGPERPGRRAVKLRHAVEGWVSIGEELHRVYGMARHGQE